MGLGGSKWGSKSFVSVSQHQSLSKGSCQYSPQSDEDGRWPSPLWSRASKGGRWYDASAQASQNGWGGGQIGFGSGLERSASPDCPLFEHIYTYKFSLYFSIPNRCSVGVESLLVEHVLALTLLPEHHCLGLASIFDKKKKLGVSIWPRYPRLQRWMNLYSHVPRLWSTSAGCAPRSMANCQRCLQRQQVIHYPIQVWGSVLSKHDTGFSLGPKLNFCL